MILQRQGRDECKLATIAMLANVPLASVRATACALGYVGAWADMLNSSPDSVYFPLVKLVCELYGVNGTNCSPVGSRLRGRLRKFKRNSKGEIVAKDGPFLHAVAYECDAQGNVTIFDSDLAQPVTLKDFGLKILRVNPVK